jgi:hypothetical protein
MIMGGMDSFHSRCKETNSHRARAGVVNKQRASAPQMCEYTGVLNTHLDDLDHLHKLGHSTLPIRHFLEPVERRRELLSP